MYCNNSSSSLYRLYSSIFLFLFLSFPFLSFLNLLLLNYFMFKRPLPASTSWAICEPRKLTSPHLSSQRSVAHEAMYISVREEMNKWGVWKKVWRVQVAHLHVVQLVHFQVLVSVFNPLSTNLDKCFSVFVVFCAKMLQLFSPRLKGD